MKSQQNSSLLAAKAQATLEAEVSNIRSCIDDDNTVAGTEDKAKTCTTTIE